MRIFYAITFSQTALSDLSELQQELKKTVRHGRWADLENLHMTMHFIGETSETELNLFKEALITAVKDIPPFTVRFTSYGSFRQGKEDLIYVKTKSSGDSLQLIADRLKLINRGDMKSFVPHITLVRRAVTDYTSLKVLKKKRFSLPPAEISSVELMESRKIDRRLRYTPVFSVKLKNENK